MMSKKHVVVEPYNIDWKQDFQTIKAELRRYVIEGIYEKIGVN